MHAKKQFYVIAYDITDDRRRQQIVKTLEPLGVRINWSVFECMLTPLQFEKVKEALIKIAGTSKDRIVIYPICRECFTKIIYLPIRKRATSQKVVVV